VLDSPPPSCHYAIALAARHQHRLRDQRQQTTRGAADDPSPHSTSPTLPRPFIATPDPRTQFRDPIPPSSTRLSTTATPRRAASLRSEPLPFPTSAQPRRRSLAHRSTRRTLGPRSTTPSAAVSSLTRQCQHHHVTITPPQFQAVSPAFGTPTSAAPRSRLDPRVAVPHWHPQSLDDDNDDGREGSHNPPSVFRVGC
jgi:hypothetical protein